MHEQSLLFATLPESAAVNEHSTGAQSAARVLLHERSQIELRAMELEATISLGPHARSVWEFVEGLDFSALYRAISSVEGRAALDRKILLALWL